MQCWFQTFIRLYTALKRFGWPSVEHLQSAKLCPFRQYHFSHSQNMNAAWEWFWKDCN
jgi:hypothetical protein